MKKHAEPREEQLLGPALAFLQRLWHLNHVLEKLSSSMEQRLGVTAQQRLMLRCVGKIPGRTAGQLATLLRVDPGTVSAALKRLERKGLLERRRDARDGRRVTIKLSARGRALARPARGTVEHAVECLLKASRLGDIATTLKVVEHLTARLDEVIAPPRRRDRGLHGPRRPAGSSGRPGRATALARPGR